MSATLSDAAEIERALDETRSRLGGHLDELQNRLTPGQLLDDVVAHFHTGEAGQFGQSLLDNVKANPVEDVYLGGVASQLRHQAADAARSVADAGYDAAGAAVQAGREEAYQQGLTKSRSAGEFVDAALDGGLAAGAANAAAGSLRAGDEVVRRSIHGEADADPRRRPGQASSVQDRT